MSLLPHPLGPGAGPAYLPPLTRRARKVGAPIGVLILLGLLGGALVFVLVLSNPVQGILGLVLTSVAMAGVVGCYLWLDRWEPEPGRLLVLAFCWGAVVAVIIALILETIGDDLVQQTHFQPAQFVDLAVIAPIVEEGAKGCFLLVMLTGRRRREMNSLTDCLVYAGITAAGFAWLEDIEYLAAGDSVEQSLVLSVLRLVASPFAHPLFTSMTAFGVWFAMRQRGAAAKAGCVLIGYLGAVVLHALWNGSLTLGFGAFVAVYLLWMVPVFTIVTIVAVRSRGREQRVVAAKLPGLVSDGIVTPAEAGWLGTMKGREAAIDQATALGGPPAGRSVRTFALAVVEVAFVRDRIDRGRAAPDDVAFEWEEAHGVIAARAAAPVLTTMASAPPRLG